uniref:Uncharacterized protein n=1 Tax=Arundo donax TaxID=35708 RepID=A0A0A9H3R5_ARUDO
MHISSDISLFIGSGFSLDETICWDRTC